MHVNYIYKQTKTVTWNAWREKAYIEITVTEQSTTWCMKEVQLPAPMVATSLILHISKVSVSIAIKYVIILCTLFRYSKNTAPYHTLVLVSNKLFRLKFNLPETDSSLIDQGCSFFIQSHVCELYLDLITSVSYIWKKYITETLKNLKQSAQ